MDSQTVGFRDGDEFEPVERTAGALDAGVLLLCDHARNDLPLGYGTLGLPAEALERHIAYDIGARWLMVRLAERLNAPALLSTFSRLLIDPNRGADDPTLVMRYSDGAVIAGNARADEAEIDRRIRLYWQPYRDAVQATTEAMLATGRAPAIVSIHSFTPDWRGFQRPWKVGVLYDDDARLASALLRELADGLEAHEIGDNEPYSGGLKGDTIDAVAISRGLPNVLIEVRQDLIANPEAARDWGDRLARWIAAALDPVGAGADQAFTA